YRIEDRRLVYRVGPVVQATAGLEDRTVGQEHRRDVHLALSRRFRGAAGERPGRQQRTGGVGRAGLLEVGDVGGPVGVGGGADVAAAHGEHPLVLRRRQQDAHRLVAVVLV